ncbi:12439_t:CDS:2 [Entrophospora sp. SA101]|nr:12439_t:CDS:2 [Entrophospora sp. SA101]
MHNIRAIMTDKTIKTLKHGLEGQVEKSESYKSKDQEEIQMQPVYEWEVHNVNVTEKFHQYQQEVLKTLKTTGLTWNNTYEVYDNSNNPYTINEPVVPVPVSNALHEAVIKHSSGQDSYMHPDETPLSRTSSQPFNGLRATIPDLAPQRTSEQEHCIQFLPDFSCVVDDGVPLLVSEIKPFGCGPLKRKKDIVRVHLRARKAINQQLSLKSDNNMFAPGQFICFVILPPLPSSAYNNNHYGVGEQIEF